MQNWGAHRKYLFLVWSHSEQFKHGSFSYFLFLPDQVNSINLKMLKCQSAAVFSFQFLPALPIRDVYPGSEFFSSRIPDLNFFHPGSASKNLSVLTQNLFLSSRKYDPGCSSLIRILIFFTHPEFRGQKGTGSRIRNRNTVVSKPLWVQILLPYIIA